MGFGAAKPGSTLPPQGGKGGVQPQTPTGYYGPIRPSMNQPAQVPPQGGKFPGSSLPPQGGKSQADQDRFTAQIIASQNQPPQGVDQAKIMNAGKGNAPVQPTVPAQGGKFPGNPIQPTIQQPQVPAQTVRPTPQPVRPAPMQPQGIAGISQRITQMRQRGRR